MNKLLHISPCSFPSLDKEYATKKIWLELAKGFEEYHILARAKDNRFHKYNEGNIYLHLVPNLVKSKSFFFTSIYMIKLIKDYKINIILSQCPLLGGVLATCISKKKNIPLMIELHGMEYFRILDDKRVFYKFISSLIKYSLNNATRIRSLSPKMTEMLKERGIKNEIVEIPNRVNINTFNKPKIDNKISGTVKVISVGRFVWEKSYDTAIKAIKNLQNIYDVELTLIGGGPLINEYKQLANDNSKINFLDWIPQEDFVPLLSNADIYIQPSVSEGMPRSIIEAMALRLPVISSNVGAISGVIKSGENGILIEANNIGALENAIKDLIENDELRSKIASNGYMDAVNKYEWNFVFEKYRNELINMK